MMLQRRERRNGPAADMLPAFLFTVIGVVCSKLQEDGAEVPIILAAFMPSAGSAIRKLQLCGLSKDPSGAN